jgi:hypothetical protein
MRELRAEVEIETTRHFLPQALVTAALVQWSRLSTFETSARAERRNLTFVAFNDSGACDQRLSARATVVTFHFAPRGRNPSAVSASAIAA